MVPSSNTNPDRYKPNQEDDRHLTGQDSTTYFQLATAIEAISNNEDGLPFRLHPKISRDVRRAEASLRRAAWALVLYATEEVTP